MIVINRLFELETIDPFTAILLTRSLLLEIYLSSSCLRWILCCNVKLFFLAGLSFIGFGVGANIISRGDPICDYRLYRFEHIAGLNSAINTLYFFWIC